MTSIVFWVAAIALTGALVALILRPLLASREADQPRVGHDLAVFQDQLAEVDRDLDSGLFSVEQAEAARTEIRRRMLAAGSRGGKAASPAVRRPARAVAVAVGLVIPAAAFGLYGGLGSPGMPDNPYKDVQAARLTGDHQGTQDVSAMVEGLAARLKSAPDDADGWAMLGKSYRALGRNEEAADALRRALKINPNDADLHGTLGETIMASAQGMVMPEAREEFLAALRLDPREPRSRFYLGLARLQIGDAQGAVAVWKNLAEDSAPDAPWMQVLRQQIAEAASAGGFDAASVAPKSELDLAGTASPGAPARADEGGEDRIRQRVVDLEARLKTNPADPEGWAMLGKSYRVLGDVKRSRDAYARAIEHKKGDVPLLMAYAEAVLNSSSDGDKLPPEFVRAMRDVLAVEPGHADALYYVGLSEVESGRKAEAKRHWSRLLAGLMPGSPEHTQLSGEIEKLGIR